MLRKCLIANRGEIAVRILRACRELGVRTVAVYSEVDADARHVHLADEAVALGGAAPSESYLNADRLIAAALATGCDCVHPGYGFLSEVETFAEAVIAAGLVWVGPPPDAIRRMGVKTEARALIQKAGVPLAPGFQSDAADDAAFLTAAGQIGYPVMVKAAGGGGGKGIRVVYDPAALAESLAAARREALHAFGDPRVYLEKFIERARHIEIQVFGDSHGNIVHLFERECSAQRRHQKVIEESPSPLLTPELRVDMGAAAVEAARAVGYVNAGTVEFIAAASGEYYFLEMNTRLQVEHPVTELVAGLDLVKLQFAVAAGEALPFTQADLMQRGHAIEARLYAEDPRAGFLPATGVLLRFLPPTGLGVRVDSGVESGDAITIHYDPMIAKIIVHDSTRAGAIRRLDAALRETTLIGTTTNLGFLRALVNHPAFAASEIDTNFIERHLDELLPSDDLPLPDAALIAVALSDLSSGRTAGSAQAANDAPGDPWALADGFRLGRGGTP
ncbi:MAG: acetyl-CoA carboxylase biotin carboxylase subunit [Anaerolineae bacterium]|nr:acetyl-CoA carboxylase biotin carboxylase subunit [Anaerolineae bacterium]NUQ02972.1 acetyl-CoA carboxylase biotin carboxylase subunit [Anaerolineae bacterium]